MTPQFSSRPVRGVWVEINSDLDGGNGIIVTSRKGRVSRNSSIAATSSASGMSRPVRGVWVEMNNLNITAVAKLSRPVRGVWVEIIQCRIMKPYIASRPVRGVWVEIGFLLHGIVLFQVTSRKGRVSRNMSAFRKGKMKVWSRPVRGVWVEMINQKILRTSNRSHVP